MLKDEIEMKKMQIEQTDKVLNKDEKTSAGLLKSKPGLLVAALALGLFSFIVWSRVSSSYSSSLASPLFRPPNLRELITEATTRAIMSGSLNTRSISNPSIVREKGYDFLLFYAEATEASLTIVDLNKENDPLGIAGRDSNLVVAVISPYYTLVLNKYNTIPDHVLLVTDEFEAQSTPLSPIDLEAWYWCIVQINGLGYYNSDFVSGSIMWD